MNSNLKKALNAVLFLAILSVLHFLFSKIFAYTVISSHRLVTTTNTLIKQAKEGRIEILVLGDSHPGTAINPLRFDRKLVVWTSGGERYYQNFYKLRSFLTSFGKPEVVILPLDFHSFKSNALNTRNDFFWVNHMDYREFGSKLGKKTRYLGKYVKGRFLPYAGESELIYQWVLRGFKKPKKNLLAPSLGDKIKKSNSGGKRQKIESPRGNPSAAVRKRMAAAKRRAKLGFYKANTFDPVKVDYFKKIMTLCRKNSIKLLLVKFPVTAEYYRCVSGNFLDIDKYYKKIGALIPKSYKDVYILDYQKIFFNRPHLMKDPDHTTAEGAKMISDKINDIINRMLL